jgi:hypothetical protein
MKKIDTLDAYIKFETNLFHLTREKKGKSKIGHRFYEKKVNLGVVEVSPYVSNGVP